MASPGIDPAWRRRLAGCAAPARRVMRRLSRTCGRRARKPGPGSRTGLRTRPVRGRAPARSPAARFATPSLSKMLGHVVAHRLLREPSSPAMRALSWPRAMRSRISASRGVSVAKAPARGSRRAPGRNAAQLGEELRERGLVRQQDVVLGLERHEARVRDEPRDEAPFLERHAPVAARMQHERRAADRAARPRARRSGRSCSQDAHGVRGRARPRAAARSSS